MQELEKKLSGLYQQHSRYEVLKDWFKLFAIALNNNSKLIHDKEREQDENDYKSTISRYTASEQNAILECSSLLVQEMTDDMEKGVFKDWLGDLFMRSGVQSKDKAQCFTPYNVGKMMADLQVQSYLKSYKHRDIITFNDPCVGGGCLPIAFCNALKEQGINYQEKALVFAQDNDELCFYMTYIQLSLIGCPAVVELKDTLLNKNLGRTRHTPLLKYQWGKFRKKVR